MTIFLECVKFYLNKGVKKIRNTSVSADKSLTNMLLSSVGMGRNKKLSTFKQDLSDAIIKSIDELKDADSDKQTLAKLQKILTDAKDWAADEAQKANYNEGNFGPQIEKISNLLKDMYKKLGDVQLLDKPNDQSALSIFRYYAAAYYLGKTYDATRTNFFTEIKKNPQITNQTKLTVEKDKILLDALLSCEVEIKEQDELAKAPDDNSVEVERKAYLLKLENSKKRRVLDCLEKLWHANEELCKKYTVSITIPFQVHTIASVDLQLGKLKPKAGNLEECIAYAVVRIEPSYFQGKNVPIKIKKGKEIEESYHPPSPPSNS